MTLRRIMTVFVVLAAGALVAAAAFWALLNVPESNVLALLLSFVLAVLIAVVAAAAVGTATGVVRDNSLLDALRGAPRAVPGLLAGAMVFGLLWWLTTTVDDQWALHRGEIDALFLRYAGTANTSWLHTTAAWMMWLVRWDLGLLAAVGAIASSYARRGALRGLATAVEGVPLLVTTAALIAGYWLWKVTYWRPTSVTPGASELILVGAKLGVLACLGLLLGVLVIHAVARVPALNRPS